MVVETKTFRRDRLDLRAAFLDKSVLVLGAVALVSGLACWQLAGMDAVLDSVQADFWLYVDLAPKMAVAFFVAALVTSLVPRQTIARYVSGVLQTGANGGNAWLTSGQFPLLAPEDAIEGAGVTVELTATSGTPTGLLLYTRGY